MRREETPAAVESCLHLIEHEQHAVPVADLARRAQITGAGSADAGLARNRLEEQRRIFARGCRSFQRIEIIERNLERLRQHRTESTAPERIAHQRESAAGEAMERALRVNKPGPAGVSAGKFDG